MNKTITIALFALLLVPISALADTETVPLKNMFTVRVAHVGDTITVVNTDNVLHTITGKDNRGDTYDIKLAPGEKTNLQFMFPVDFAYYDKYNQKSFGALYTYEPSTDLAQLNVYNKTSVNDLYTVPQYLISNSTIPVNIQTSDNSTTLGNVTAPVVTNSTQPVVNQTVAYVPQLSAPTLSAPNVAPTIQDNGTLAQLKSIITLQKQQLDYDKAEIATQTKQIIDLQDQIDAWRNVAERLSQLVQSLQ